MARSADLELRQWWRELIDSFDPAHESVAKFCDRHEVSTASYYAWRRKLAKALTSAGIGRRRTPGAPPLVSVGAYVDARLPWWWYLLLVLR